MSKKHFNKDRFFYGYTAEVIFQQTFPSAKKLVNGADFRLNDYLVEIGRSRVLEKQIIVYARKLLYNIKKENKKDIKSLSPEMQLGYILSNTKECIVPPDKFLFVYFTNNINYFTVFTYKQLLESELKKKRDGEYYFKVKGDGLIKVGKLYETIADRVGISSKRKMFTEEDFGVFLDE